MLHLRIHYISLPIKAVQLDTADGLSWSILGNAYFAHFFNVSQNPRTLKQSMSAYRQGRISIDLSNFECKSRTWSGITSVMISVQFGQNMTWDGFLRSWTDVWTKKDFN